MATLCMKNPTEPYGLEHICKCFPTYVSVPQMVWLVLMHFKRIDIGFNENIVCRGCPCGQACAVACYAGSQPRDDLN